MMRSLLIALALAAVATPASAARPAAGTGGNASVAPAFTHPATGAPVFFTLQAAGALLTVDTTSGAGKLTLAGVAPQATWWTERPARAAGGITTAALAADARLVGEDGAWLSTPNAALAGIAPLGEGQGAAMANIVLTLTSAPVYEPAARLFSLPVSLVGIAPLDPWGEPVGGEGSGGGGGEGGGGSGTGGGGGPGVSSQAAPQLRNWRDLAAAQAAARTAATGKANAAEEEGALAQLTLQGASLIIDQWLLPTSYSQGADGWCVSAMDPNCQPWYYYGGGGSYWMY